MPFAILFARLRSTVPQLHMIDTRAQCAFMLDRTSVAIECTSRLLISCTLTIDRTLLALERTSANCTKTDQHLKFCQTYVWSVLWVFVLKFWCFVYFCFMLDICLLNSEGEAWIFRSVILMFPLVIGHQLLPTTLKIYSQMNHVYATPTLIIIQVIVHHGDNFPIFHMGK